MASMSFYNLGSNHYVPLGNASSQTSRASTSRGRDGPFTPNPASPVPVNETGPGQAPVFSREVVAAFREATNIMFAASGRAFQEVEVSLPRSGTAKEIRTYRDLCREFLALPEYLRREVIVRHNSSLPLHVVPSVAIIALLLFGIPSSKAARFEAMSLVGELFRGMIQRFRGWQETWMNQYRHNPVLSSEATAMRLNDIGRAAIGQRTDIEADWLDIMLMAFGDVPEFWGFPSSPSSTYCSAPDPLWEAASDVPTNQSSAPQLAGHPTTQNASASAAQDSRAGGQSGHQSMGIYAPTPVAVSQTHHLNATPGPSTVYDGATSYGRLGRLGSNVPSHPTYTGTAYGEPSLDSTTGYGNVAWSGMDGYNRANPSGWNTVGETNRGATPALPTVPHVGAFSGGVSASPRSSNAASAGTVNPSELAAPRMLPVVEGSGVEPSTGAQRVLHRRSLASASISSRGSRNSTAPSDIQEMLALEQTKVATLSAKLQLKRQQTIQLTALTRFGTSQVDMFFGGMHAALSGSTIGLPIPKGHLQAIKSMPDDMNITSRCISMVVNEEF